MRLECGIYPVRMVSSQTSTYEPGPVFRRVVGGGYYESPKYDCLGGSNGREQEGSGVVQVQVSQGSERL